MQFLYLYLLSLVGLDFLFILWAIGTIYVYFIFLMYVLCHYLIGRPGEMQPDPTTHPNPHEMNDYGSYSFIN